MHISEVEKARLEKDHKMRNGYQIHDNKRYPINVEVNEYQHLPKDMDNKHAREYKPEDFNKE